jgi:hypothetical protein
MDTGIGTKGTAVAPGEWVSDANYAYNYNPVFQPTVKHKKRPPPPPPPAISTQITKPVDATSRDWSTEITPKAQPKPEEAGGWKFWPFF